MRWPDQAGRLHRRDREAPPGESRRRTAFGHRPIYVTGAEPGDTLEIRIKKIVIKEDGFNFSLPGKQFPAVGLLPAEFPEGHVQYFKLT